MIFAELFGMMMSVCADDLAAIDRDSRSAAKRANGDEKFVAAAAIRDDCGMANVAEFCSGV
jgi:hypothetical protein